MGKKYTEKELVEFGNYVLSRERMESILVDLKSEDSDYISERLSTVYDADIRNWEDTSKINN